MSIYVYAILFSSTKELDFPQGIQGRVEMISYGNIAVIIERDILIQNLQKTEDILLKAIVTHDQVIQSIFSQVSLLPLRFGTGFTSLDSLLENLKNNQSQYNQKLHKLTNCVEYCIKFIPLDFKINKAKDLDLKGKSYLLAKKKNYQLQQEFISNQENQWKAIKESISQEFADNILIQEQEAIKQIFLLEKQQNNIDILINSWQQKAPNWQITTSLPLPCYHFANV